VHVRAGAGLPYGEHMYQAGARLPYREYMYLQVQGCRVHSTCMSRCSVAVGAAHVRTGAPLQYRQYMYEQVHCCSSCGYIAASCTGGAVSVLLPVQNVQIQC
jgi:hypothetical protein